MSSILILDDQCKLLIPPRPPHDIQPLHPRLDPDPRKHHPHAGPLSHCKRMIKHEDTQKHRKQLSRHRHHRQRQTAEMLDRLEDEELAEAAQEGIR